MGEIMRHLGLSCHFSKEVLEMLGIWMNDQLRKGQGDDFKEIFYWEFWGLGKDGESVRKS